MIEQSRLEKKEIRAKSKCSMLWWMIQRCNFDCTYCFRDEAKEYRQAREHTSRKYSAEHIAERFDETGKVWYICLTGGEPLLYPDFVELVKKITRRHYISLGTNLSTPNAYELAEAVDSERIYRIDASAHIQEREKIKDGKKEFLRKLLLFQERGFNIKLVYVMYPPFLSRIKEDVKRFRGEGVKQIRLKIFRGRYDGRSYPRDYSSEEREFIKGLDLDDCEQEILARRVSFLGKKCQAGHRAFNMDMSGNVTRCGTLSEEYGNLFEGTFRPGESSRRCPAKKCEWPYQGINFTPSVGFTVPPDVAVRLVRFSISVGEWVGGLKNKVLR